MYTLSIYYDEVERLIFINVVTQVEMEEDELAEILLVLHEMQQQQHRTNAQLLAFYNCMAVFAAQSAIPRIKEN
jgi:NifU-like protein involved in Fe-S cluster formation